jgi:hypothetical protein
MLLKLIACEVFMRETCHCLASSPHTIDVEFTEKGAHDKSDFLREQIQQKIDAAQSSGRKYDAVLLCYGLCGNGVLNLESKDSKVVIPRAHDCCTVFLGSKEKFKLQFAENPSLSFNSTGYMERGDSYVREASQNSVLGLDRTYEEYVTLYGEENAKYIMETLNPCKLGETENKVVFIEIPETQHLGYAENCKAKAEADGKEYVQLEGDMRIIRNLVYGDWNDKEFLVLEPHQRIIGVYDWDEIVRAENVSGVPQSTLAENNEKP